MQFKNKYQIQAMHLESTLQCVKLEVDQAEDKASTDNIENQEDKSFSWRCADPSRKTAVATKLQEASSAIETPP
jgi:hypothetical protein